MKPLTAAVSALALALALACGAAEKPPPPAPPPPPPTPAAPAPPPPTEPPAGAASDAAQEECCCTYSKSDDAKAHTSETVGVCEELGGTCEGTYSICEEFAKKACCCITEAAGKEVRKDSTRGECDGVCVEGTCAAADEEEVEQEVERDRAYRGVRLERPGTSGSSRTGGTRSTGTKTRPTGR